MRLLFPFLLKKDQEGFKSIGKQKEEPFFVCTFCYPMHSLVKKKRRRRDNSSMRTLFSFLRIGKKAPFLRDNKG